MAGVDGGELGVQGKAFGLEMKVLQFRFKSEPLGVMRDHLGSLRWKALKKEFAHPLCTSILFGLFLEGLADQGVHGRCMFRGFVIEKMKGRYRVNLKSLKKSIA